MSNNILQITDLGNEQVQVSWQVGNQSAQPIGPIHFDDPLTDADHAELRWYLEEFLRFPYGAERYRAEQIERKMEQWGEALFQQVFVKLATDPDPRSFYQEAVRAGLEQCELCVVSDEQKFLNIPWELMRDPVAGRGYLAPHLAGFYRQRVHKKIEAPAALSATQPFRVLLVIARPYGERDVSFGTIARPMAEALRSLRPRIELEVLRPPTFDELQKRLNANRGFYNLVHFDGHGVFAAPQSGAVSQFAARAEFGHLAFENAEGSAHIVNSKELGEALASCKVPLFVLNACQSAQEGKIDAFGSVASQLVAIGARGVVAMSYSVYATTASRFITRFYESLAEHQTLAEAVAAARLKLFADAAHDSVVGPVELRDWIVPVLYQQEQRYVPVSPEAGTTVSEAPETINAFEQANAVCPARAFGFIGRDYDILRIERALRDNNDPWVVLSGIGGVGKTELAYGFARWYAETGGCPGGVFATEFETKADFAQIVGSIVGFGTEFSRLSEPEQQRWLIDYLRKHACLLVWDNFEPVAGYPEGSTPRATDEERAKLANFLQALRGGKSRVLITTRKTSEQWLGIAYHLIKIKGLNERDAAQLAKKVLQTVGRSPGEFKDDLDYSRLIDLLNGHARSIEVVLPLLEKKRPAEIIDALQHRVSNFSEAMEDASLAFAFSQMSEKARKHLPFVGLFTAYVDAGFLGFFMKADEQNSALYVELFGKTLDAGAWESLLEEAARCGLLRSLGSRLYELHPTLPVFLRRQLVADAGEDGLKRLDIKFLDFYVAIAVYFFDATRKADRNAINRLRFEEANLLRALRLAEKSEQWRNIQIIVQLLGEFYEITGRADEWGALRGRLLHLVGRRISADADRNRASLWMYLVGDEANQALRRGDLDNAELANKQVLDYLLSLNDPTAEPNISISYHQLGLIAQERQQFDLAEQWYKKALEISERLGLERNAASDYHHLGMVAQERQQFDLAEQWYKKALEIFERLGLERDAADEYHELGNVAYLRQQFDLAEQWYKKTLEIRERLKHSPLMVNTLAQLGLLRRNQERWPESVAWLSKALMIAVEYQMRVGGQILQDIASLMKDMGEQEFIAAWQQASSEELPPGLLNELREVMKDLE